MSSQEFRLILKSEWPEIEDSVLDRVDAFRSLVCEANKTQNLTRLLDPKQFYEGHVLDARILVENIELGDCALDLGSGVGVPGLLSAILKPKLWVLCESEGRKADFLSKTVEKLELSKWISVYSGRAEEYLKREAVQAVVCRAVGPIERIMGWIGTCSTWNNLVLFKGPKWDEEWNSHESRAWSKKLTLIKKQDYVTPFQGAKRTIVQFARVPRGTIQK